MSNGEDEPFVEYYPNGARACFASARGIMLEIFSKLSQSPSLWGVEHTRTLVSEKYFYKFFYRHFPQSTILVVAEPEVRLRIVTTLLNEVQNEILHMQHPSYRALYNAVKDSVEKANLMGSNDKITMIQQQVDDMRDAMVENLEQVIGRSVQIEVVESRTDDLAQTGKLFRRDTRKVRCLTACRGILCCGFC